MIEDTLQYRITTALVWRLRLGVHADALIKAHTAMSAELAKYARAADIHVEADDEFIVLVAVLDGDEHDTLPGYAAPRPSTMGGAPPPYTAPSVVDHPANGSGPYEPTDLRPDPNVLHGEIAETA